MEGTILSRAMDRAAEGSPKAMQFVAEIAKLGGDAGRAAVREDIDALLQIVGSNASAIKKNTENLDRLTGVVSEELYAPPAPPNAQVPDAPPAAEPEAPDDGEQPEPELPAEPDGASLIIDGEEVGTAQFDDEPEAPEPDNETEIPEGALPTLDGTPPDPDESGDDPAPDEDAGADEDEEGSG